MKIYFKLKAFPQISETFIVSNLVYAKQKDLDIKIYVDKYLGLENSSQASLLKKHHIEDDVVQPYHFSSNKIIKLLQAIKVLSYFRIFTHVYAYYKLKRKKNLSPLAELYQYRKLKNALVHVHFNNALQALIYLRKVGFVNPKCIITYHGYDAFIHDKKDFQKKFAKFYQENVVAVTTNSNYLKKQVISLGVDAKKIKVIPIGINFEKFKGEVRSLNNMPLIKLITVGRLVQLKGQIYVIRALRELINQGFDIQYIVVGDGHYEDVLKEEVQKLNLQEAVKFEGAKSQDEIISYMQEADIFMMSSTYDDLSKRREAFGLVSIEAQASGLPVIGFKSGGFPDTIIDGKTGFAVEDRNHLALAKKIQLLVKNEDLYKEMSAAAIENASKYDLKYTTQQYLDLYKKFSS